MTRREFIRRITEDYAHFALDVAAHHADSKGPAPLDNRYAFSAGTRIVERGEYTPRKRWLDYEIIAREARKMLPGVTRGIERAYAENPDLIERRCRACGGTIYPTKETTHA